MKSYQSITSTKHDLQRKVEETERKAEETEWQKEYLCKQLGKSMRQKQRVLDCPSRSNSEGLSEAESQHSIYEEDELRRPVRARRPPININSNDFRVDIPEFKGKLDPEEFLTS